ncbi:hypothetical protein FB45DRAFT_894681 [Roridomyces roridus]|uniref:rRNA-processing protein EFG1 n=1 Tax=Roridomyces roridus TaxID=1738132 RepID=A0AAD7FZP6_9AGAR|nr:hypothetical protein FB45DRAFT_894681 [Roridomyces roridus]
MGPTRTKARRVDAESAPVEAGPSKPRTKPYKQSQPSSATPGVQKLKSSLRQTRRLLAKDNLAADVRVETERRLRALEADLEVAESSKKERTLAVRYHKVKFFERQKVVRKLNQTKKKIAAEDSPELQSTLHDLRVDLNYILHYPKTKKYISLFPPELRNGEAEEPVSDAGRDEVRAWVVSQMESGDLSAEPELHMDEPKDGSGAGAVSWGDRQQQKQKKKKKNQNEEPHDVEEPGEPEQEDAFFGDDDDDEDA